MFRGGYIHPGVEKLKPRSGAKLSFSILHFCYESNNFQLFYCSFSERRNLKLLQHFVTKTKIKPFFGAFLEGRFTTVVNS